MSNADPPSSPVEAASPRETPEPLRQRSNFIASILREAVKSEGVNGDLEEWFRPAFLSEDVAGHIDTLTARVAELEQALSDIGRCALTTDLPPAPADVADVVIREVVALRSECARLREEHERLKAASVRAGEGPQTDRLTEEDGQFLEELAEDSEILGRMARAVKLRAISLKIFKLQCSTPSPEHP